MEILSHRDLRNNLVNVPVGDFYGLSSFQLLVAMMSANYVVKNGLKGGTYHTVGHKLSTALSGAASLALSGLRREVSQSATSLG